MILQSLKMAWKSIRANKPRAFLTMLGIIIGVMSLVVLVSLVNGATSSVTNQIASMGNDVLTVSVSDDKGKPLKLTDLERIAELESVALVAPTNSTSATAKQGTDSYSISVTGTTNAYFHIMGSELTEGRFLLDADRENNSRVVVLSYEAADRIFGRSDVVGQTLKMDGVKYLIIGVLVEDTSLMSSFSQSYAVYVPYSVVERMPSGSGAGATMQGGGSSSLTGITNFSVTASESSTTARAEIELTAEMLSRLSNDEDAFNIRNQSSLSETLDSVTGTFSLLLGGIAAISLVVGGIGIMNIMLVSVTERTREIGIRKAIGARRASITLQFLIEALVICLIGCFIGIVASGLILMTVNLVSGTSSYTFSGGIILIAVAFSTFIGIVFGLYPANKAARMRPIDALRYE
jgi:putative ABC transport system permease protein